MKPRVAVIVRTKNRPKLLRRTINSVIEQSYFNWILIIVNNGGNLDDVQSIVEDYKENYNIKIIHMDYPCSMETATNVGIINSESEFITLLDDDDTWEPIYLETCVKHLESNNSIDGVVTRTKIINEKIVGEEIIEYSREKFNSNLRKVSSFRIAKSNLFTTNSFMYRRSSLKEIGLYREDLPVLGDWEFNIRFLLKKKKIKVIPMVLSNYHKRIENKLEKTYNNTSLITHKKYDELIRKEYFHNKYKNKAIIFGFLILFFGKINFLISKIKNAIVARDELA